MTLTEFLEARIAEDEAMAEAAAAHAPGGEWGMYDPDAGTSQAGRFACVGTGGMHPTAWPQHAAHIARHDPARVLAECEAKWRIVELARGDYGDDPGAWLLYDLTLKALAMPYADHPDYQPEWRV